MHRILQGKRQSVKRTAQIARLHAHMAIHFLSADVGADAIILFRAGRDDLGAVVGLMIAAYGGFCCCHGEHLFYRFELKHSIKPALFGVGYGSMFRRF